MNIPPISTVIHPISGQIPLFRLSGSITIV